MLRPFAHQHRRGAVLIVVLAMLVLFAVLGLSFVLYSEAQLSAARSQKQSVNQGTDPKPQAAAEAYLGGLIYDVGDTGDDLSNPIRGHSLARSKYGCQAGQPNVLPFSANPMVMEPGTFNFNGITDSRQIVRFTWDTTTNSVFDPERFYNGAALRNSPAAALTGTYAGKNYAFTYPDRHDYYLAWQDPTTGRITLPSFHRPDLGSWDPTAANNFEAQGPAGKFRTLRPRVADGHANFPPVPPNTDGTYTGDVQNMKFTAGVQHNDSFWMDAGGPVLKWRGKQYKAMVAPLVLDLSSRVNLSVAGSRKQGQTFTAGVGNNDGTTGGSQGLGPWEIDPQQLGLTAAEVQAIIARRQGSSANPPSDPYTTQAFTARVNGGRLPPAYSLLDVDGDGSRPAAASDPFTLPAVGGFTPFPSYIRGGATLQRYPFDMPTLTAEAANHPAQFNPLLNARGTAGAGGFGHDDLIRVAARYSDPKGRHAATASVPQGLPNLNPTADTPAAQQMRALVTTFSTSQIWASTTVATNNTGGTATLGPVDLNRPLPSFRKNTALPLSPVNVWPAGSVEYTRAATARHTLARDIWIRLSGQLLIDGTSAVYSPATGNVTVFGALSGPMVDVKVLGLAQYAQLAANVVDFIDDDDLMTAFAWNPTAASLTASPADPTLDQSNFAADQVATRVVFGTELPRLVISEVYGGLFNTRDDPFPGNPPRASRPLRRRYWIELQNPTPPEAPGSPARSDLGAARLQYQNGVTQLTDPTTLATGNYTGATFNPYRLEVAEMPPVPPGGSNSDLPYSWALKDIYAGDPYGVVAWDTADAALFPNLTLRARVNTFTHDATAPSAAATLTGDALNVVLPTTAAASPNGGNQGYYLIGPRDQFPAGGVANSLSLPDPAGGVPTPAAPVNALTFDVTAAAPTDADIAAAAANAGTVILRRLLDPYRPAQENPANPEFNPFITVDYMENVHTRDRATHSTMAANRPVSDAGSVGRRHPYVNAEYVKLPKVSMTIDQVNAGATPPHTWFNLNTDPHNSRGTAPTVGFEWLVHLDRELISLPEIELVSTWGPTALGRLFHTPNSDEGTYHGFRDVYKKALVDTTGLFEVGGRRPGSPLGGREAGRVNINTVNAQAALQAAFGRTDGTYFGATNPSQVANIWATLSPPTPPTSVARTPNRVPRATLFEAGTDTPFRWGRQFDASSPYYTYFLAYYTRGRETPVARKAVPYLGRQADFYNGNAPDQSYYLESEPLRKVWNNITPVSDSFLVMFTVGFFEVTATSPAVPIGVTNPPLFGAELFDKVPGDLRAQYAGVVDRSALGVDPNTSVTTPASETPFQTRLRTDLHTTNLVPVDIEAVPPSGTLPDGTVLANTECALLGDGGRVRRIIAGDQLWVGYGVAPNGGDGESLRVTAVAAGLTPGTASLTLAGPITRPHGAGSLVTTGVFGSPGPQPGVSLPQLQARGLVPFLTRLDP